MYDRTILWCEIRLISSCTPLVDLWRALIWSKDDHFDRTAWAARSRLAQKLMYFALEEAL